MSRIKIYGERNTGTNYLQKLIAKNFEINLIRGVVPPKKLYTFSEKTKNLYFSITEKSNLGWKHAKIKPKLVRKHPEINRIYFITLTKNPYSFLLSLYNRPYHYIGNKPPSFSEFIRDKWITQKRDKSGVKYYDNPISLWNDKNKSYIELNEKYPNQTYNMKFESLLFDFESELSNLISQFKIKSINDDVLNIEQSTKDQNKSNSYYKDYYLNELWVDKLCDEDIEYINNWIDHDVVNYFGYDILKVDATKN